MCSQGWQDEVIEEIREFFLAAPDVGAVAVFGSSKPSSALRDVWSDVDAVIVVEPDALSRYHPGVGWTGAFGALYTWEQSSGPFTRTTRCCFRDGRRIDFVFTTPADLQRLDEWPLVPWWQGARVLFSRSEGIGAALARATTPPAPPEMTPEAFETMLRGFRFKALLAVTKVVRGDLLIALHLALELQQECCVLGMILRDRVEGTSHHRSGGVGNAFVADLQASRFPFTASGILDGIERCTAAFDDLAGRWLPVYRADRGPLEDALEQARTTLL